MKVIHTMQKAFIYNFSTSSSIQKADTNAKRGGAERNDPPPISRPDGIPDSLIISWIDNT
jgi:hypothetical protein